MVIFKYNYAYLVAAATQITMTGINDKTGKLHVSEVFIRQLHEEGREEVLTQMFKVQRPYIRNVKFCCQFSSFSFAR